MKTFCCILISFFCFSLSLSHAQIDCSFPATADGFDYTLDVDLNVSDPVFTQNGTTCNVSFPVAYVASVQINSAPFGPVFFLNIGIDCGTPQGVIAQTATNPGTTMSSGSLTIGSFAFQNTVCSSLVLDCATVITTQGGGGLNETNTVCGEITGKCARHVF